MMQGLCGSILFALTGNTNLVHLEVRAPLAAYALVHLLRNTLDTFHSAFSELSEFTLQAVILDKCIVVPSANTFELTKSKTIGDGHAM
jgi:hypothetical protein